jgi:uncharacterized protein YbjT (DUF2867 family)
MKVVIAGGHGKIALGLTRLLAGRGDVVIGLVRDPAQVGDVAGSGGQGVVCDLEYAGIDALTPRLTGADAAVFAADAGPGSGEARKDSVDRGAAVLLAEAAEAAGVRRLVQISTMGAGATPDPDAGQVWAAYIRAKTAAEEDLRARPLDWTILRPGRLTDEPPTGLVRLGEPPVERGRVPRGDVAAVIAALLDTPRTRHRTLELVGGDTPVPRAVAGIAASVG